MAQRRAAEMAVEVKRARAIEKERARERERLVQRQLVEAAASAAVAAAVAAAPVHAPASVAASSTPAAKEAAPTSSANSSDGEDAKASSLPSPVARRRALTVAHTAYVSPAGNAEAWGGGGGGGRWVVEHLIPCGC